MSSSAYPMLDDKPIDKLKVTELREELKKRSLPTKGLKEELIKRLAAAIQEGEQEEEEKQEAEEEEANQESEKEEEEEEANQEAKEDNEANQEAEEEEANQESEKEEEEANQEAKEDNEANQDAEITPVAPIEAVLSTETAKTTTEASDAVETATEASDAVETATEASAAVETATEASAAVETTPPPPPPVLSKPEAETVTKANDQDQKVDDVGDIESSVVDVKDAVSEPIIQKSADKNNEQVSSGVTGIEVKKSDCISTDSVSNNEKIELELKDNEIAADNHVKLDQNVSKSQLQEPSGGESHPMDVEEPLEQQKKKISVEDDDTKENNLVVDAGDSEKLNLDRSSGDESMEDEPETKLNESVTSDEVLNKSEKTDMVVDDKEEEKEKATENVSHPVVTSEKRKLPTNDQEAVRNNEPVKRQRRWNSESVKVPEVTNNVPTTITPRSAGLKRDFARSDSSVSEDGPKERVVPPSPKEPTNSLRIDRFLRPFTLKAVQELLGKTGNVTSFWMDHIKTHCYVSYGSVEEAAATREAVYNLQWPPNGGRLLMAEFVGEAEVKAKLEAPLPPPPPPPTTQAQPLIQPHALPPPPPLVKQPQVIERLPLPPPPPPPPVVNEEQEAPIVTLDDLFKKTKAIPRIYYLPLSEEQVAAKLAANNNK